MYTSSTVWYLRNNFISSDSPSFTDADTQHLENTSQHAKHKRFRKHLQYEKAAANIETQLATNISIGLRSSLTAGCQTVHMKHEDMKAHVLSSHHAEKTTSKPETPSDLPLTRCSMSLLQQHVAGTRVSLDTGVMKRRPEYLLTAGGPHTETGTGALRPSRSSSSSSYLKHWQLDFRPAPDVCCQ